MAINTLRDIPDCIKNIVEIYYSGDSQRARDEADRLRQKRADITELLDLTLRLFDDAPLSMYAYYDNLLAAAATLSSSSQIDSSFSDFAASERTLDSRLPFGDDDFMNALDASFDSHFGAAQSGKPHLCFSTPPDHSTVHPDFTSQPQVDVDIDVEDPESNTDNSYPFKPANSHPGLLQLNRALNETTASPVDPLNINGAKEAETRFASGGQQLWVNLSDNRPDNHDTTRSPSDVHDCIPEDWARPRRDSNTEDIRQVAENPFKPNQNRHQINDLHRDTNTPLFRPAVPINSIDDQPMTPGPFGKMNAPQQPTPNFKLAPLTADNASGDISTPAPGKANVFNGSTHIPGTNVNSLENTVTPNPTSMTKTPTGRIRRPSSSIEFNPNQHPLGPSGAPREPSPATTSQSLRQTGPQNRLAGSSSFNNNRSSSNLSNYSSSINNPSSSNINNRTASNLGKLNRDSQLDTKRPPNLSLDGIGARPRRDSAVLRRPGEVNPLPASEDNYRPTMNKLQAVRDANCRPTSVGLHPIAPQAAYNPDQTKPPVQDEQRGRKSTLETDELSKLHPLSRTPRICINMAELSRRTDIDAHAGFILSLIDGVVSINDVLSLSAWSQTETAQILCNLKARNIIDFD